MKDLEDFVSGLENKLDVLLNNFKSQLSVAAKPAAVGPMFPKFAARPMSAKPMSNIEPTNTATGTPNADIASVNPANADKSLPWFKHGVRGFLRKLWYGNRYKNSDGQWSESTSLQSYLDFCKESEIIAENLADFIIVEMDLNLDNIIADLKNQIVQTCVSYAKDNYKKLIIKNRKKYDKKKKDLSSSDPVVADSPAPNSIESPQDSTPTPTPTPTPTISVSSTPEMSARPMLQRRKKAIVGFDTGLENLPTESTHQYGIAKKMIETMDSISKIEFYKKMLNLGIHADINEQIIYTDKIKYYKDLLRSV